MPSTPHGATSDSKGTQVFMALHHIDPPEQAVIDTDGDESQYLLETGEPVTVPLDYQSLTPEQVIELQELLHKFPELTSDKLGCTDVLEHDVNVGMLHQSESSHTEFLWLCDTRWKGSLTRCCSCSS